MTPAGTPASHGEGDPSLETPRLPPLDQPLPSLDFPLRATLEPNDPVTLAGRRVRLRVEAAASTGQPPDGRRVTASIDAGAASLRLVSVPGAGAVERAAGSLTPLGMECRLETPAGPVAERLVVSPSAAVWVAEWESGTDVVLSLTWTCDLGGDRPDQGPPRWRSIQRGVLLGRDDPRGILLFSDPLHSLDVNSREGAVQVRAALHLAPNRPQRLLVAAGPDSGALGRTLGMAARPDAMVRARLGHARRLASDRLRILTAGHPLAEPLEWAKLALDAPPEGPVPRGPSPEKPPGMTPRMSPVAALATLAAGDPEPAREAVLEGHGSGAAHLLLAGEYIRWTGDLGTIRAAWPDLADRAGTLAAAAPRTSGEPQESRGSQDSRGPHGDLTLAALSAVADAAEAIGEEAAATALRPSEVPRHPPPLLMLAGPPSAVGPAASPELRHSQAAGGGVDAAARVVAHLVGALLGVEPDATRGRLVLRPRPAGDGLAVAGIMVGKAVVGLHYSRDGSWHRFRLEQERGGAPLSVVFEPGLPGRRLVSARVDGQPADLDARMEGDRLVVPVQLVMDHPRLVELELDGTS